MKKFIAYFDYLGFRQFIENNDLAYQTRIMKNNFRDIERALAQGKLKEAPQGYIADLTNSNINCINFSDTIVFWTNDDSENSLKEILDIAYTFNWQAIGYFFPVRGSLVFGEIINVDFKQQNSGGGVYNINSVYGKGLVKAYERAEAQNWAGTIVDESFLHEVSNRYPSAEEFLNPYAKKYNVPYRNGVVLPEEYVLRIVKGSLNDEAFKNFSEKIENNFGQYNKSTEHPSVKEKIKNTLIYLESFHEKHQNIN